VTVLGEIPTGLALTRAGAKPGDDVYVSGALGDAALALAAITDRVALGTEALTAARERLEMPVPRIALGIALRRIANAAIDVSDGLTGDLGHILEQSAVGADIDLAAVPRSRPLERLLAGAERAIALECLLGGGDDYELLFTAPRAAAARVAQVAAEVGVALTRIGTVTAARGLTVRDELGTPLPALPRAFDHFA
jgi:thiamine-monophosphate kinase